MCWKTNIKENISPKTADNDITCYKIMLAENDRLNSYFQGFEYQKGTTYFIGGGIPSPKMAYSENWTITDAFHSYGENCSVRNGENYIIVTYGDINIQAYTVSGKLSLAVVRCTIPKGSTYYLNEKNEYASSQIIINDVIKIYNPPMNVTPLSKLGQYVTDPEKNLHIIQKLAIFAPVE